MRLFSVSQLRLLAEFFANLAVVWFATALIAPTNLIIAIKAILSGLLSIYVGLILIKEVEL